MSPSPAAVEQVVEGAHQVPLGPGEAHAHGEAAVHGGHRPVHVGEGAVAGLHENEGLADVVEGEDDDDRLAQDARQPGGVPARAVPRGGRPEEVRVDDPAAEHPHEDVDEPEEGHVEGLQELVVRALREQAADAAEVGGIEEAVAGALAGVGGGRRCRHEAAALFWSVSHRSSSSSEEEEEALDAWSHPRSESDALSWLLLSSLSSSRELPSSATEDEAAEALSWLRQQPRMRRTARARSSARQLSNPTVRGGASGPQSLSLLLSRCDMSSFFLVGRPRAKKHARMADRPPTVTALGDSLVVRILTRYARNHGALMGLSALCVALVPFQEVVLPQLYGGVLAALQRPGADGMRRAAGMVVVALLAVQGCLLLRDRLNDRIHTSVQAFVKVELLEALLAKHAERYVPLTTGEIVYILNAIPDIACLWFRYMRDFIVPYTLTFAVVVVVLARFDRALGLGFGALVALLGATLVHAPRECFADAHTHSAHMGRLHDRLEEVVANLEAVYTSDRQGTEVARLRRDAEPEFFAAFHRTGRCARRHKMLVVPLVVGLLGLASLRLGVLVRDGRRPPARATAVFVLLTTLVGSVLWIVDLVHSDILDVGQLAECDRIFGGGPAPGQRQAPRTPPPGRAPPPADRYALGLVDVTFAHGAGAGGVRGLTVHFERGERTALVGPVGAGKTTVLRLLLGLHVPAPGGDAYYDGRWYADQPLAGVRRAVGYVPQQPVLFDRSVLDNVRYGSEDRVSVPAATALLEESGLAARLPEGVSTRAGKGGQRLSGGQRQLVWCLRVLLQAPAVLLMDEPTASMDAATRETLLVLLDRLMRGRTVVFVSHDPALVAAATRRVALPAPPMTA